MNNEMNIRAHHGMCLSFFAGKGYDSDFASHMAKIKNELEHNPKVRIVTETDEICARCPNSKDAVCISAKQVENYDNMVLSLCGMKAGTVIDYISFSNLVNEKILQTGKREHICGDCQWNDICYLRQ